MSANDPGRKARARFFMGVGQAGTRPHPWCEYTMPLFSLAMILDTEGWLADDAKPLLENGEGDRT